MKAWLAVWTKPRQEARAVEHLRRQSFEVFCPQVRERRQSGAGAKWVTGPLFPRYLFVRVDASVQSIAPIRSTIGCIDLIRRAGHPATVPDDVISSLQAGPVELDPAAKWTAGDPVNVIDGPFTGLSAIYRYRSAGDRIRVLIEMMGCWRPVDVPTASLASA